MDPRRIGRPSADPRKRPNEASPSGKPAPKVPRLNGIESSSTNIVVTAPKDGQSSDVSPFTGAPEQQPSHGDRMELDSSQNNNDVASTLISQLRGLLEQVTRQATLQIWNDQSQTYVERAKKEYDALSSEKAKFPVIAEQKARSYEAAQHDHLLKANALAQSKQENEKFLSSLVSTMIGLTKITAVPLTPITPKRDEELHTLVEQLFVDFDEIKEQLRQLELEGDRPNALTAQEIDERMAPLAQTISQLQLRTQKEHNVLIDKISASEIVAESKYQQMNTHLRDMERAIAETGGDIKKLETSMRHPPQQSVFPIQPKNSKQANGISTPGAAPPPAMVPSLIDLQHKHMSLERAISSIQKQYDNLTTSEVVAEMVKQMAIMYPDIKNVQVTIDNLREQFSQVSRHISEITTDIDRRVTQLETRITGIESHLRDPSLARDLDYLQTVTSTMQGETTKLQNDTQNLQSDTSQLQRDMTRLQGDTVRLQGDTSQVQADTSAIRDNLSHYRADSMRLRDETISLASEHADFRELQENYRQTQEGIMTRITDLETSQDELLIQLGKQLATIDAHHRLLTGTTKS